MGNQQEGHKKEPAVKEEPALSTLIMTPEERKALTEALRSLRKDGGGSLQGCFDALHLLFETIEDDSGEKGRVLGLAGAFDATLKALARYGEDEHPLVQLWGLTVLLQSLPGQVQRMGQDEEAWTDLCDRIATVLHPMMQWDLLSHLLNAAATSPPGPTFTMDASELGKGGFQHLAAAVIGATAKARADTTLVQQSALGVVAKACPFGDKGLCERLIALLRCRVFLSQVDEIPIFLSALTDLAAYEVNQVRRRRRIASPLITLSSSQP